MEAPGITLAGLRGLESISPADMVSPQISWPYQAGVFYTVAIAAVERFTPSVPGSFTWKEVLTKGSFRIKFMQVNVNPSEGLAGDLAVNWEGPALGRLLVMVFQQAKLLDPPGEGDMIVNLQDLANMGLQLRHVLQIYVDLPQAWDSSNSNASNPDVGGLQALVRRALSGGRFVDVSRIQPGPYGKGIKGRQLHAYYGMGNRVGLLNVPDFPIVSDNAGSWDLAMEILGQNRQNKSWSNLIGRWNTAVPNPGIYSRENLAYFLEPGAEISLTTRRLS